MSIIQPLVFHPYINIIFLTFQYDKQLLKYSFCFNGCCGNSDDRFFNEIKYARIIELIKEKQRISLEEAMDML